MKTRKLGHTPSLDLAVGIFTLGYNTNSLKLNRPTPKNTTEFVTTPPKTFFQALMIHYDALYTISFKEAQDK